MTRLSVLPEDVARLVWRNVFNECLKDVENKCCHFWRELEEKEYEKKLDLYDEYSRFRTIGLSVVIKQEQHYYEINKFLNDTWEELHEEWNEGLY